MVSSKIAQVTSYILKYSSYMAQIYVLLYTCDVVIEHKVTVA